eukprot:TRINITY_DN161_c0_g1_i7.p2 TRINITY_DN161_c0_g1~~TRINITY_DN161_c0_g1_i7.p2  ORF type:complete len:202 (+),score=47.86 TRINITY_DN161_c0_g1_i7:331-936(+)
MYSDDEDAPPPLEVEPAAPAPINNGPVPQVYVKGRYIDSSTKTGPKGVIHDYKASRSAEHARADVDPITRTTPSYVPQGITPGPGNLTHITQAQYVACIDESVTSYVVVHLSDPGSASAAALDETLQALAEDHPSVTFVTIKATEAKASFDTIACPTLVVYRHGQVLETFIRVTDTVGPECNYEAVERLLQRHGVLSELYM